MRVEPAVKRTVAFVDGQNLFHAARDAFRYTYPNYDIHALASAVCRKKGWSLAKICFYTGVPDLTDDPYWNRFWSAKLMALSRQRVIVFSRSLRYSIKKVRLPNGKTHAFRTGREKGIDVRIALDVIHMGRTNQYDVAMLFSQDQDLSEVAREIRLLSRDEDRWIKVASAYPVGPGTENARGIDQTDWIEIDKATYDACIDPHDYRAGVP